MGQSSSAPGVTPPSTAAHSTDPAGRPRRSRSSKILVVGGAGTMGSSTALHLARRGYTDVRILDVYQAPSADSAGNDLNKIAGSDTLGRFGETVDEAWKAWTEDPVFAPFCHSVGRMDLSIGDSERARQLRRKYETLVGRGRTDVEWLDDGEAIKRRSAVLRRASIPDWRGLICANAGWVAARDALNSVALECRRLGVKTAFGTVGTFQSLLLSEDGRRCVGVKAVDGTEWEADVVVLAAGAWSPVLVDLQGQCESKAWGYAHVQLSPEEYEEMKGMPTMYNDVMGFFIEPRPDNHLLKFCNEFAGYTSLSQAQPFGCSAPITLSVPRSRAAHPTDTIPTEMLDDIKRLIATCLPQLVGRPLVNQGMCWCTDTADAEWLICEDPRWEGLILATGDSGHTFKHLPVVGKEVADLIEGQLSEEKKALWKWRPGRGDPKGTGRGGPAPKDLSQVGGWRHDS